MRRKIQRISKRNISWFQTAFAVKGSVIDKVLPRVILIGLVGFFITILYTKNIPVALPILAGIIPNIVIGLLLVFRTNTAYERFWEGQKLWGSITNTSRNLAREITISIPTSDNKSEIEKQEVVNLITCFAYSAKDQMRGESIDNLSKVISREYFQKINQSHKPALHCIFLIQTYLQKQFELGVIDSITISHIKGLLNNLVDSLGGCERILKTPIPLAYSIHLKQLLIIYCLSLPFQFVGILVWWTIPVVMLVSFTLFGIEEIGIEIENPFGNDKNDLPLDDICQNIKNYIAELSEGSI
jgi:ion channel-forming bestrophin family protein